MNILTYVDPTPRGEWALKLAAELAGRLARRVVLLATEADAAAHPGLLDSAAVLVGALETVVVEKKVRPGRARDAIVEEARENSYEITIFPPAGRSTLQRIFHGSRLKSVLRRIPSSVLVARRPSIPIRRILAALKGTHFAQTTAGAALEVARGIGAELTGVHVVSQIPIPAGTRPSGEGGIETMEPGIGSVLEGVREEFRAAGRKPEIKLREGMVVEEVVHEVEEGAYDLLVLGHHMPKEEDLDENITERIILWCPVPVLVVQPRKVIPPKARW